MEMHKIIKNHQVEVDFPATAQLAIGHQLSVDQLDRANALKVDGTPFEEPAIVTKFTAGKTKDENGFIFDKIGIVPLSEYNKAEKVVRK